MIYVLGLLSSYSQTLHREYEMTVMHLIRSDRRCQQDWKWCYQVALLTSWDFCQNCPEKKDSHRLFPPRFWISSCFAHLILQCGYRRDAKRLPPSLTSKKKTLKGLFCFPLTLDPGQIYSEIVTPHIKRAWEGQLDSQKILPEEIFMNVGNN